MSALPRRASLVARFLLPCLAAACLVEAPAERSFGGRSGGGDDESSDVVAAGGGAEPDDERAGGRGPALGGTGGADGGGGGDVDAGPPPDPSAAVPAPTGGVAFVGGPSVAVRWSSPRNAGIARWEIRRDGVLLGSVTPGFHAEFPERDGSGYVDRAVQPGARYTYRVRALTADGRASEDGAPIEATTPATLVPPPRVTFDTAAAPDLDAWARRDAAAVLEVIYPKVAELLTRPAYVPPAAFTVRFDPTYQGVAYADPPRALVVVSAAFARANPRDLGMFVHEATHVAQNFAQTPGWIVEGLADWPREYMVHDRDPVPIVHGQHYTQGYSQGSFFLDWVRGKYAPSFLRDLMAAGRAGRYADALFVQASGKTIDGLWLELTGEVTRGPGAAAIPALGRCIQSSAGRARSVACNGGQGDQAFRVHDRAGTLALAMGGACLDVASSGVANGTRVQFYPCNGSRAQRWTRRGDGSLMNPQSGRCLDVPAANTAVGTELQLYDCIGGIAQRLRLPGDP